MKYVKVLVLSVVAAAALMAFVGSATASATVLCKTEATTCPSGWAYGAGTKIHGVNEETSVTTATYKNIECNKSTFTGPTANEEGTSIRVSVETWTFEECNCEVKILKTGTLQIEESPGGNGTVTSNELEETVSCSTIFGNVHCIYSTKNTAIGLLTGSGTTKSTATLDVSESVIANLPTSFPCAEKDNWHTKYSIASPDALFVGGHT